MKNRLLNAISLFLSVIIFILVENNISIAQQKSAGDTSGIFRKSKLKILVTDSGLGGLSVVAEMENLLSKYGSFNSAEIIFINALPRADYKYNSMSGEKEKARVFNDILFKMYEFTKPDIIFIACNTLSVVFPLTEFAANPPVPVIDIASFGVNLIAEKMLHNPNSDVLIMGTETTISSGTHKAELIKSGIEEKRIFGQSYPNLESEIQNNPEGDIVSGIIDFYSDDALGNLDENNSTLYAALCCSHYGYSANLFEKVLKSKTGKRIEILNPNSSMSGFLIKEKGKKAKRKTRISVKVISQALISESEINSLFLPIKKVSVKTANALKKYELKNNLFPDY